MREIAVMTELLKPDLCVIGGGSGGLSVAAGAAQMGADVVLVERGAMGGDCLNVGCIPSKALIAAAHSVQKARQISRFGACVNEPRIYFDRVHGHVHDTIAAIAPHDSVARFESLGVRVICAEGEFTDPRQLVAGGMRVQARRFVIATGSTAFVPPIPRLNQVSYLTNESIFGLTDCPEHLIIIGGGPIGVELAQAFRRLGARVTVIEMATILGRDDNEAVEVVRTQLRAEGVDVCEGVEVIRVADRGNGPEVTVTGSGDDPKKAKTIPGSHLLVAVGRRPVFEGLALDAAHIEYANQGIVVDRRLRTSNKRIFAIGDVIDSERFTHLAHYHADIVIKNALFRWPARIGTQAVPRVTYADPEIAQVGLTEAEARKDNPSLRAQTHSFADNDRARAERETAGFIKVITGRRGKILGATIVGAGAGELILPWVLAINQGLKIGALAGVIVPYPTRSEVSKHVAGHYFTPTLFGPRMQRLVRWLSRLP